MRCRPGDLAFIVRCVFPENLRKLVRVVERSEIDAADWRCEVLQTVRCHFITFGGATFGESDAKPGEELHMRDACLQPIRPGDAADETLTWAGLPADQKTTVEA